MLTPNREPPNSWSDKELDELDSADRQRFDNKMKDPKCIKHRVIVKPHDYYEQNRVTVFAPQTKLTPEQVFWPLDVEKIKAEEIKAKTPHKLAALMVYPPNTPMHLVQLSLPSQCKTLISIYVICQMFTDFDKTCKKRITPTGITEGERGFELTKECYLTEVIPFFKLIKEHFEGLRQSLDVELKEMKEVFKNMEIKGKQIAIDLQHSEIARKNILIMNDNLISKCISQDVFYTASDSSINACHFHEMSVALNDLQNRVVELEGENLKLHEKIQNDDHDNMVKHFSKLEVDNLNLQLKYQHLEESVKRSKAKASTDVPEFDTYFELAKRDETIQAHTNTIRKLRTQIAQMKSPMYDMVDTHKPQSADSQSFQLQNMINKLQHENDCFQAENSKVKQHYKELYDSIKITRDKTNEKITSLLYEIENLKNKVKGKMPVGANDSKVCECKNYACEAVFIPLPLKNNELVHSDYLRHLKNCLDMIRETIEEVRMVRPSDNILSDICFLTKWSQVLLEYTIGTCPKIPNMRDRNGTSSSRNLKKHVTFDIPLARSDHSTSPPRNQTTMQQSNIPIVNSTGVINVTKASESKPKGNTRNDRTSPAKSDQGKKVED
jgi:hypothetical protein